MNKHLKVVLAAFMALLSLPSSAKGPAKHKKKTTKEHLTLIEAYTQRTLPGIPGQRPSDPAMHIIIVWERTDKLEACFWRGENGWMSCGVERVHKVSPQEARNFPPGMAYMTEAIGVDQIHQGDTVSLTPVKGGKFPIPKEIPATAKNTLFYKAGGINWLAFPIKDIGKKPDLAMP